MTKYNAARHIETGFIPRRFNYSYGRNGVWEVMSLSNWVSEDQIDFKLPTIPISEWPDTNPVSATSHPKPFDIKSVVRHDVQAGITSPSALAVFEKSSGMERSASPRASAPSSSSTPERAEPARPRETLEQASARLDTYIREDRETRAQVRGHEGFVPHWLRTHLKPVGPWIADHTYGPEPVGDKPAP